jgi:hypothetical protein
LKEGIDPETGSRYLEEIAFEVQNTQRDKDLTERARMLVRRGVRRVFAVKVREDEGGTVHAGPVKEWSPAEDRWVELEPESEIVDRCFRHPIKVKALLDATEARAQVFRGYVDDNDPLLVAEKQKALDAQKKALAAEHARQVQALAAEHARQVQAREQALAAEHARAAILDLCEVLAIEVTGERRARMEAMTGDELNAMRNAIRTRRRWPEA